MPLTSAGLSILTSEQCRRLLESHSWGRVILSIGALPAALPVNYRVVDDQVVFRTGAGGKLAAALDHTVVGFEIDEHDEATRSGWSVLVVGAARPVTEPRELDRVQAAGVDSWLPDQPDCYVAISIVQLSGRELNDGAATFT